MFLKWIKARFVSLRWRNKATTFLIGNHNLHGSGLRRSNPSVGNITHGNMVLLSQDFKEFLALLNDHKVRYLVVGGFAVAFHGHPRYIYHPVTPWFIGGAMGASHLSSWQASHPKTTLLPPRQLPISPQWPHQALGLPKHPYKPILCHKLLTFFCKSLLLVVCLLLFQIVAHRFHVRLADRYGIVIVRPVKKYFRYLVFFDVTRTRSS